VRRRGVSLVSAIALIVSVTAGTQSASADNGSDRRDRDDSSGVGTITWGTCDDLTLVAFGAECGMLSVPLDYSKPRGTKIQLAVSRVVHTVPDDQYQGPMLVNPGGPGGSGLIYAVLGAFVPGGAGETYDWIGFDPRGVGSSIPALSCIPDYAAGPRPPYEPAVGSIERAWLERASGYAEACGRNGGALLDHLKTTDNAKDMNAIRQALGAEQISYYGFSYGTYLGQAFATLYPSRVHRMVLDANVDPTRVWYKANLDQDYAFEKVFQLFLDWVARHDSTYHLGTSVDEIEAKYYAAQGALAASPRGQLGAAEWADAFLVTGYVQFIWPDVAAAFAAFVNDDDPAPITDVFLGFVDTTSDNGYAIYLATECTDARWPQKWSTWRRDNNRVARDAPFLTWANAWFNAPCAFWPARSGHPVNVHGDKTTPILLISDTLDAATPLSGSIEVRKRFRASSLIVTEGTNHANSLFGGNVCVDDQVGAYLLDGTMPDRVRGRGPDAICPALPEPEPFSPVAAASTTATGGAALVDALQRLQSGLRGRTG
jgi:pimeloyl-ACP methyl ester carboxylesterase